MHNSKRRQWLLEERVYRYRRKRKHQKNIGVVASPSFDAAGSVRSYYTKLIQQLNSSNYICKDYARRQIYVPENFSFKQNYDETIVFFKQLISSYFLYLGSIIVNFEKCKTSSIAAFSILGVILANIEDVKNKYNFLKHTGCRKNVKIVRSLKDVKTNKYLHAFLNVQLPEDQNDGSHFLKLPFQNGKQRNYKENPKTKVSSVVVDFVNKSTEEAGAQLKLEGRRAIEHLMGEVLGTAEDHSAPNSYWYVDAISFVEKQDDIEVVDLNLTIMNVGLSMYEGFESTKVENAENYSKCEKLYNLHKSQFTLFNKFERESLFTMYMLNDGISRLKYEDESRGNGTMKFLDAFITIGSFGKTDKRFKCQLNVISGHTVLTCDNDMHSYKADGLNVLSLNTENDFRKLPDKSYLAYHKEYFPGTILECHIYLNKNYFEKRINSSSNVDDKINQNA